MLVATATISTSADESDVCVVASKTVWKVKSCASMCSRLRTTAPCLGTSAYSAVKRRCTSDDRNGDSMAARICSKGDLYFGALSSSVSPKNPERDLTCNPG